MPASGIQHGDRRDEAVQVGCGDVEAPGFGERTLVGYLGRGFAGGDAQSAAVGIADGQCGRAFRIVRVPGPTGKAAVLDTDEAFHAADGSWMQLAA